MAFDSASRRHGGLAWGLAVCVALVCLIGLWWVSRAQHGADTGGLRPEVAAPKVSEPDSISNLRGVASEGTRVSRGAVNSVAPAALESIDWQGAPLEPWRGSVLSNRGALPLAGCLVEFRCDKGVLQTETNAAGEFEWLLPRGQEGTLVASLEGFQTRAKPNVTAGPRITMLLIPSASILGTFDGDASGLQAHLHAAESDSAWAAVQSVPLDESGGFRFENMAAGLYSIRLGPSVYAILKNVTVEAGDEVQVHLQAIETSRKVRARVVTQPGGQPVAGCAVEIRYHALGMPGYLERDSDLRSQADDQGRFEFLLGEAVRTSVSVRAPWGGEKQVPYLEAQDWKPGMELEVPMPAPARLAGKLLDLEGNGIAGGELWLCESGQRNSSTPHVYNPALRSIRTAADGGFDFGEVPSGERLIVTCLLDGQVGDGVVPERELEQIKLKAGQHKTDLRLRWGLNVRVAGQVLDTDGEPLAGVRLDVLGSGGRSVESGWTDALGNFLLPDFPCNASSLTFELQFQEETLHRQSVKVPRRAKGDIGTIEIHKDFQVARKVLAHGWILDDEGFGVPGLQIHFSHGNRNKQVLGRGVSQEAGDFAFSILDRAETQVEVSLRSRTWRFPKTWNRELPWPLPDPLILQVERTPLEPGGQIRGEVLVEGSNEAVSKLRLAGGRSGVLSTEGSRFFLRGIRPGRLKLSLQGSGMADLNLPAIDLTPGMDLDLGVLRMHRACDLTLEFSDLRGRLPKGSQIRLVGLSKYEWDSEWKPPTWDLTRYASRRGAKPLQVRRRGVPRGRWKLEVEVPGFQKLTREIRLNGRNLKVPIGLKRKGD